MRSDIDASGPLAIRDQPQIDIARGRVEPEDIARAVVIEIADPHRLIAGRMRADIDAAGPLAVRDLPQIHIVRGRIEPQHVAGAVTD